MAPELMAGQQAAASSDIFSLGVVLYQLLLGDWTHPLTTDWKEIIGDPVLRDVLEKCFVGNPRERLADASQLAGNLRSVEKRWRTQRWVGAGISALVSVCLGLFLLVPFPWQSDTAGLAGLSLDLLFWTRPLMKPTEAVVVFLDEESHRSLAQPFNAPWDRTLHAKLVERLTASRAKAVVFDIIFAEPASETGDERLGKAFKENGRVILGGVQVVVDISGGQRLKLSPPFQKFQTSAAAWGSVNLPLEPGFVVRKLPLQTLPDPSLAIATAKAVGISLPTAMNSIQPAYHWINYYGPPGTIPHISYWKALDEKITPHEYFRDKVVFIGVGRISTSSLGSTRHEFATPFTRFVGDFSPGVEIHATAFLNFWRRDWLRRISPMLLLGMVVLTGGIFGAGLRFVRNWVGLALTSLGCIFVVLLAVGLFRLQQVWFPWISVLIQIVLTYVWCAVTKGFGYFCVERRGDGVLIGYLLRRRVRTHAM